MKTDQSTGARRAGGSLPLRVISSIWLGVTLLALMILYSAVGSAVPPFRQYFELTEFQYFNHWAFGVLTALFCISLTAATVTRIRFNRFNAGVITVHTGLLILAGGSVLYFGRKIEGDVLLWNPRVHVLSAQRLHAGTGGNPVIGQAVAATGASWEADMPMAGGKVHLDVTDVAHNGIVTASDVSVKVTENDGPPRTIKLSQDSPQNAFVKLNDKLFLQLNPSAPASEFFDNNTAALLVRRGNREPTIFSLRGLPYYNERFVEGVEPIVDTRGESVRSERLARIPGIDQWQMPIRVGEADGTDLSDWPFTMTVDGYLPYADLRRTAASGGSTLDPLVSVGLEINGHSYQDQLFGMRPRESKLSAPGASVEFAWLADADKIPTDWTTTIRGRHVVDVWVKDKDVRRQLDMQPGQKYRIEGTDYELEIRDLQADWPLATVGFEGARTAIARIWVTSPAKPGFERSVLQRYPELNQDRDAAGKKLVEKGLFDDNIELRYFNASQPSFRIAAGRDMQPVCVYTAPGGERRVQKLEKGKAFEAGPGVKLVMQDFIREPRFVETPIVVPDENRRPQSRRDFSLVRLQLKSKNADWEQHVWLPYEPYNDLFVGQAPRWMSVAVPNLGQVEFLYGRLPRPLPGRVALEQMEVHFYPGGDRPSEWKSHIRWEEPVTRNIHRGAAFLNNTTRIGPWTLFQSSAANDHVSFTVLGVGNRDGVMTMLLGCFLCTVGMMYAFYVKPWLKRRTRDRLAALHAPGGDASSASTAGPRVLTTVGTPMVALVAALLGLAAPARAQHDQPQAPDAEAAMPDDADHVHAMKAPPDAASLVKIQGSLQFDKLRTLMIQHGARYQTIEAWARQIVASVHGRDNMLGLDPVAAAFELMLNRGAYDGQSVIYVKDMALRKHITGHPVRVSEQEARRIIKTGLVSFDYLRDPTVSGIVNELSNKFTLKRAMDRFSNAVGTYQQVFSMFTVVPSPAGQYQSPWFGIEALLGNLGLPDDATHGRMARQQSIPGISPEAAGKLLEQFRRFGKAWIERDVAGINTGIEAMAATLPSLAPKTDPPVYPPLAKREMEVLYHKLQALTFGWAFYIVALFISIWALSAGWNWLRWTAIGAFLLAFALHGAGLAMRWAIIGRVPVANMFEAVVSSAWLGAAVAIVLEFALKRRVFVLAGSFLGALSLVLGKQVGAEITQIAPILDDIMLRIHTVLIIASYAIITLGFAVAVCYLVVAARQSQPNVARVTLGVVSALGLCALLATRDAFHPLIEYSEWAKVVIPVLFAVVGALLFVVAPRLFGGSPLSEIIAAGPPAAASIVSPGAAVAALPRDRTKLLEAFDLSHMILLHMATIALFVGLVLGAIWADYSWGRPWGWDPKEVFALVTWMFYAILIHARFVAKRKALWSAVLSCIGFAAMQFNWWVVNFYIVGLHSYA